MTDDTVKMNVPPEMVGDTKCAMEGCYDVPLDPPPKTVLDLGGCYGAFSCWAMRRWPECRVTAYEPIKANYDGLEKNLAQFSPDRYSAVNKAVGSTDGRILLWPGRNCQGEWTNIGQKVDQSPFGGPQAVECMDAAGLSQHEFVKLDIEGSELEVLRRMDLSGTRALAMEAHFTDDMHSITRLLTEQGFAMTEKLRLGTVAPANLPANAAGKKRQMEPWLLKFVRRSEFPPGYRRLMFASPVYRLVPAPWVLCMMASTSLKTMSIIYRLLLGDSAVYRARNSLMYEFLASDCTHVLFVDSDVLFTPQHIEQIMAWPDEFEIVGGCYPKRQNALEWCANSLENPPPKRPDGLQEVKYVGTGFMRITRSCLEKVIAAVGPSIQYPVDCQPDRIEHHFFPEGIWDFPNGTRRLLSEDWAFCQRWRELGGKVWLDTNILLSHVGEATYPLPHQVELLQSLSHA
jgi:FkbM family methyltransferase